MKIALIRLLHFAFFIFHFSIYISPSHNRGTTASTPRDPTSPPRHHSGSGLPFVSGAKGSTTNPRRNTPHIVTPA